VAQSLSEIIAIISTGLFGIIIIIITVDVVKASAAVAIGDGDARAGCIQLPLYESQCRI